MLTGEVQNRIEQYNPWLTQPDQAEALIRRFLPETYVVRAVEPVELRKDRSLLIVGPRQAGKSTLVWCILQSCAPNILYINLEDPLLRLSLGVAEDADRITALEVKFTALGRPNISRAARSFIDAYHPERFVVVSRSLQTRLTINGYPIDFETPHNLSWPALN